jgi:hypothetical protein
LDLPEEIARLRVVRVERERLLEERGIGDAAIELVERVEDGELGVDRRCERRSRRKARRLCVERAGAARLSNCGARASS